MEKVNAFGRVIDFPDGTVIDHICGGRGVITSMEGHGNPTHKAVKGIYIVYIYADTDPFDIEMYKRQGYKFSKIKYQKKTSSANEV